MIYTGKQLEITHTHLKPRWNLGMFSPDMIKKPNVKWGLIFTTFIFTIKISGHYELPIFTILNTKLCISVNLCISDFPLTKQNKYMFSEIPFIGNLPQKKEHAIISLKIHS